MMEAITTAPMWLVILCAILGGAVLGHLAALMRPEKIVGIVPKVEAVRIEEGDTLVLTYPELFNKEQRAALVKMVEDRFPQAKGRVLTLEGGISMHIEKPKKVDWMTS